MSSKDNDNPLKELQKQLQEALKKSRINVGFRSQDQQRNIEDPQQDTISTEEDEILRRIKEFNLKPREIRDYLNRFVVKQQEAKKVLSVAICDHYNHVRQCIERPELLKNDYNKNNILILGPTGVGKTYLMRNIARLIGVPFVKADATKFSETGYVGGDVEDLVRDLVKVANGNADLAQYGIIYIDEIDKIASDGGSGEGLMKDISGRGVQINLLKLMEDTEVNLFSPTDMMAQMQAVVDMSGRGQSKKKKRINTRHILFIVSGAFDKLAEMIKRRLEKSQIGFGAPTPTSVEEAMDIYLKEATTNDFIKYGFEPEFVGRVPVRVSCESLNQDDLARILTSSEGSILRQYKEDFQGYGIDFDMTDEAVQEIAGKASKERTGARGLLTVLESVFRDFKFELPSTPIKSFEVTTDTIATPSSTLKKLLIDNQHLQKGVLEDDLRRFAVNFENEHGLRLNFDKGSTEVLIEESIDQDRTIRAICEQKFKDFQHGLQIVSKNTNTHEFTINKEVAVDPDKVLSDWVVESFKKKKATEQQSGSDSREDTKE